MKKIRLTLIAALFSTAFALAEPNPVPVITIENAGNHDEYTIHRSRYQIIRMNDYKVTAIGEGEVHLYLNGEEVENPYIFSYWGEQEYHQHESNRYEFMATAQTDGGEMSQTTQEYVIPSLPMFYLQYNQEDETFLMQLDYNYDYEATVMYRVSRYGQGGDWQVYEEPFEIWRAPDPIRGRCYVEVICYAGGLSSNMGIMSDWAEDIGYSGIYRYYEFDNGIYIASYPVDYEHDNAGVGFAPLYDTMCNKYWNPERFPGCYSGDVVIPETIVYILDHTFYNCTGLTSVSIPPTVTNIGEEAFEGCTNLQKVEIQSLGAWCAIDFPDPTCSPLYHCGHLYLNGEEITDLEIGYEDEYNIGSINGYTFAGLNEMRRLVCKYQYPPGAAYNAFYGLYDWTTLFVPAESIEDYRADEEWGRFTHIVPFIGFGPGDVNGDYSIDVDDVTGIIGMILEGQVPAYADVNGDGLIDIDDITVIISKVLNFER